MNKLASILIILMCLTLSFNCKKEQSTAPQDTPDHYAGVWTGTTGQGLPIYFRITQTGLVDSLTVRISLYVGLSTCTGTFVKDSVATVQGGAFSMRVMLPGSNVITRVRATLTSSGSGSGTYDGYGGSFSIICGGSFMIGTSGGLIGKTTWQVTKTG